MNLRDIAEQDLEMILEDHLQGFAYNIILTDLDGRTDSFKGQSGDIHFLIDPETGQGISGRFAHISIRIKSILNSSAGFLTLPVKGWKVSFNDLYENTYNFIIIEARPDRTLGIITCMLGGLAIES